MGRSLSFDDICERGEVRASVSFAWALLYKVCQFVVREVCERPEWKAEAGRLVDCIDEVISNCPAANNAVSMYALLVMLFTYMAVAIEQGALEVVELEEGGEDGCWFAISLN